MLIGYVTEPKITDAAHGKMAAFGKMAENLKVRKGDFVFLSGECEPTGKMGLFIATSTPRR
jgi:hypothetical protein